MDYFGHNWDNEASDVAPASCRFDEEKYHLFEAAQYVLDNPDQREEVLDDLYERRHQARADLDWAISFIKKNPDWKEDWK